MPWLKYIIIHAAGPADPEYVHFPEGSDINELKFEINELEGDGFRQPRWEILADNELPSEILEAKIKSMEELIDSATRRLLAYEAMRKVQPARPTNFDPHRLAELRELGRVMAKKSDEKPAD